MSLHEMLFYLLSRWTHHYSMILTELYSTRKTNRNAVFCIYMWKFFLMRSVCTCKHKNTLYIRWRWETIITFLPLDPFAAVLLVSQRSEIIANRVNIRPPLIHPVVAGSSIVTVDFDHVTSRIYWADVLQKKIWSAYQNGTDQREVRKMKA